jgi:Uma2 family endonuclease
MATMGQAAAHVRYSYADYRALEDESNVRHEYRDGEILAMAGGTPEHAELAGRVLAALSRQLEGKPCRVYPSDLRIRILATGLATYPDVSVVCGPVERDPGDPNAVTNPRLLVEVLSDRTEAYDRGAKLDHYRQLTSLSAYLLVSHRSPELELRTRSADGWTVRWARAGEVLKLEALAVVLDVEALYAGINLSRP